MYLKRLNAEGSVASGSPEAAYCKVLHAPNTWHPAQSFLDSGIASGHISLSAGKVVIKTAEGEDDLVYKIVSAPGFFCCHCGMTVGSSKEGVEHIAKEHQDAKESPDPMNPSGVRRNNHFVCEYVSGPQGNGPTAMEVVQEQAKKNRRRAN